MNLDTENQILDRAERSLQSASGGRNQSEASFLQALLRDLGGNLFANPVSPADLFRAALNNRPRMQMARELLEVLAVPSRCPQGDLRAGDWLLRAVPGTGDGGHISVLVSGDLLSPATLSNEGIASESVQPGYYGLVIEAGAFPHSRFRPCARRVLDSRGRVSPNTIILRPKYSNLGAQADFPPNGSETDSSETAAGLEELGTRVGRALGKDIGVSERVASVQEPVAEEDLGYDQILQQLRRELDLPFTDPNDPGLARRRLRLRDLFQSVPRTRAKELHARLGGRLTGDALSTLFQGRLATPTRRELLKILEDRFPADPTPPTRTPMTKTPCRRGMGFMGQLLSWERGLLALIHDKSEADFKGVGVLIGPVIIPGAIPSPLDRIVKTALQHDYAITIENHIWFPRAIDTSNVDDLAWLIHESVHVVDYQLAGIEAFLMTYARQAIIHKFRHDDIPHEKRANLIEAAAKGMLARFPDLVASIRSCDDSAILNLLQSKKAELQNALNESMSDEYIAAPQIHQLSADNAAEDVRVDDAGSGGVSVEPAPQARSRIVFYDRETLRYLDGWTRAAGPSLVILIDRGLYDTTRADGANRARAYGQFVAQALATAGRGRTDLMPPVFAIDPTLSTVPINRHSRDDWDDLMITRLILEGRRLTIPGESEQWTQINRQFSNAKADARDAAQRQRAAREFAAYFLLDVINATLMMVEATNVTMVNGHADIPLGRDRRTGRLVAPSGDAATRVIGTIHTHYLFDPFIDLDRSSVGTTIRSRQALLHSGVSDIDVRSAQNGPLVVYAVDSKYLHRANPNGTKDDKLPRSGNVLRESLRIFGGEPGPTPLG